MIRATMSLRHVLLLCCAVLLLPRPAAAITYGFDCITGNNLGDCAILEDQITVDVTAGSGAVNFRFANSGPENSSITVAYFNDLATALLGVPSVITYSSGVSFSGGCSPHNLPGGSSYGFSTSYCADSNSPVQPNGVNPGEWLNISFALQNSATFDDVIEAIENGSYRIGVRVQGFATGGSEGGIARVPEPSSLLALASGLIFLPAVRRRRRA